MPSDDLFGKPAPGDDQIHWDELEKRINRLLEGIVQLRNANAQLMKENVILKNQMHELVPPDNDVSEGFETLRRQYDEAIQDLKQVKQNLQKIETLAADLKIIG